MKSLQFGALRSNQRGVTLIVALIFLAILMLLGVTVAQTSSLEERMAGNTRDRDLALQSAEAGLKVAEAYLKSQPLVSLNDALFNGSTAGLIPFNAANENHAAYWNAYDWDDASQDASTTLKEIAEQPKYVIEKLPDAATTKRFRVTARGIGSSANTAVILQAGYERETPP
jgi:type IV pilus assembly protein PilX